MSEKEVEIWRKRILPSTHEDPDFMIFKDDMHEVSEVALRGIFAGTHAELVDAEIKLDIVASELERRTHG